MSEKLPEQCRLHPFMPFGSTPSGGGLAHGHPGSLLTVPILILAHRTIVGAHCNKIKERADRIITAEAAMMA